MKVALAIAASLLGHHQTHRATYYSTPPCDQQTTRTASGQHVRFGIIASNILPFRSWLRFDTPLHGRRYFQVLDTGAPFDIWLPCGPWTRGWTNPIIGFRIVAGQLQLTHDTAGTAV